MKRKLAITIVLLAFVCLVPIIIYIVSGTEREQDSEEVESYQLSSGNSHGYNDRYEQYVNHVGQKIAEEILDYDEAVLSADVAIRYNDDTQNYVIVLSLTTDDELTDEQISIHKTVLSNSCDESVLIINGDVK